MTKDPILYTFRRCPYAMRARLALYHEKIDHEHREVDLKNKPQELLTISPKGTVPVLELTEGTVLEQSLDIMIWAFGNFPLSAKDMALIEENDTVFKRSLDRYKYPDRYPHEEHRDHRGDCEIFLKKVERHLDPFLSGDALGLLDMALFPFVRQFALVNLEWFRKSDFFYLQNWLNIFELTDLYKKSMMPHEPWEVHNTPVLIRF